MLRKRTLLLMLAAVLSLPVQTRAQGDDPLPIPTFSFVAPKELADVEGNGQVSVSNPIRSQEIYAAENFGFLRDSPQAFEIFALRLRPDGVMTAPLEVNYERIVFRMASTEVDPFDLTDSIETNLMEAGDVTIVYEGPVTTTTMNHRLPNGTMEFDSLVTFQTPIVYSPDDGNLLFDSDLSAPDTQALWDFSGDPEHGGAVSLVGDGRLEPWWTTPIQFSFRPVLPGDYDGSGELDADDIDQLSMAMDSEAPLLDTNQDGMINDTDRQLWIRQLAMTLPGDADLNGAVDFADFLALSESFGQQASWSNGDFDGNGSADFPDFLILSGNFGLSVAAVSVPEPNAIFLASVFSVANLLFVRRRRQ